MLTRVPKPGSAAPIVAGVLALLIVCPWSVPGWAGGQPTKVPGKRFSHGIYTAPDGAFTIRFQELLGPSPRALEQDVRPGARGVQISDDFGTQIRVVRDSNAPDSSVIDDFARDLASRDTAQSFPVTHGRWAKEVRYVNLSPGGSPVVSTTMEGKKAVDTRLDLYEAWCIFADQGSVYFTTAGVSRTMGQSDSLLLEVARQSLEELLGSIEIRRSK